MPHGHPNKSHRLSNLGSALSSRFGRFGDFTDIDKSIMMIEEAILLTPDGYPDKPSWLDSIGGLFLVTLSALVTSQTSSPFR